MSKQSIFDPRRIIPRIFGCRLRDDKEVVRYVETGYELFRTDEVGEQVQKFPPRYFFQNVLAHHRNMKERRNCAPASAILVTCTEYPSRLYLKGGLEGVIFGVL